MRTTREEAGSISSIYDHFGKSELAEVPVSEISTVIDSLSQAEPADLTNDDYHLISDAQNGGQSFQLFLDFKDNTSVQLYVIPSLGTTMIGDDRYTLPEDFNDKFGSLFEGLSQQSLPAQ